MQAISVIHGAVPTLVAAAGNRDFLEIYNNSDATIYLCYDSDVATAMAQLTTAKGMPIAPGTIKIFNNDGNRNVFTKPVYAIHADAALDKELRIQGA